MSEPKRKPATYEDLLRAPEYMVAELIEDELHLAPRPGRPPGHAELRLGSLLDQPFGRGKDGPGGWVFHPEPELHLKANVLVPDLAAWRSERMPLAGDEPYFSVVPDWICEIVSPSTGRLDRIKKLPIYAANDVRHAWIVDPAQRSLEVYRNEGRRWVLISTHAEEEEVRAEPFEAVPLELAALWI
jgi:Uma2 family endonuclease